MARVVLTIPNDVLIDFYKALGAVPKPEWTIEEQSDWARVMFLEPFILRRVYEVVKDYRIGQAVQKAQKAALDANVLLDAQVENAIETAIAALPEKLRPPEPTEPTEPPV